MTLLSALIYGSGGPVDTFFGKVGRTLHGGVKNFSTLAVPYMESQKCFMAKPYVNGLLEKTKQHSILKDGGCTADMSGDKSLFVENTMRPCRVAIEGFVQNEKAVIAAQRGTIKFIGAVNGAPVAITIKDVLYVPQMGRKTLLSQGKFMAGGGSHASRGRVERQFNPQGKPIFDAYLEETDNLLHVEYEIAKKGGKIRWACV
jgi:hypothetical protein